MCCMHSLTSHTHIYTQHTHTHHTHTSHTHITHTHTRQCTRMWNKCQQNNLWSWPSFQLQFTKHVLHHLVQVHEFHACSSLLHVKQLCSPCPKDLRLLHDIGCFFFLEVTIGTGTYFPRYFWRFSGGFGPPGYETPRPRMSSHARDLVHACLCVKVSAKLQDSASWWFVKVVPAGQMVAPVLAVGHEPSEEFHAVHVNTKSAPRMHTISFFRPVSWNRVRKAQKNMHSIKQYAKGWSKFCRFRACTPTVQSWLQRMSKWRQPIISLTPCWAPATTAKPARYQQVWLSNQQGVQITARPASVGLLCSSLPCFGSMPGNLAEKKKKMPRFRGQNRPPRPSIRVYQKMWEKHVIMLAARPIRQAFRTCRRHMSSDLPFPISLAKPGGPFFCYCHETRILDCHDVKGIKQALNFSWCRW